MKFKKKNTDKCLATLNEFLVRRDKILIVDELYKDKWKGSLN